MTDTRGREQNNTAAHGHTPQKWVAELMLLPPFQRPGDRFTGVMSVP